MVDRHRRHFAWSRATCQTYAVRHTYRHVFSAIRRALCEVMAWRCWPRVFRIHNAQQRRFGARPPRCPPLTFARCPASCLPGAMSLDRVPHHLSALHSLRCFRCCLLRPLCRTLLVALCLASWRFCGSRCSEPSAISDADAPAADSQAWAYSLMAAAAELMEASPDETATRETALAGGPPHARSQTTVHATTRRLLRGRLT
jgi:hypothetical protein